MRLTRRVAVNVAVFAAAFVVMLAWAVNEVVSVDQLERPYHVAAEFANAFGIVPNAEVTYLGIGYGTVRSVERMPGGARVHMEIEQGKRIPRDATAKVARKSAIGEPYVDFAPPLDYDGGGPYLAAGAVVPRDRTRVPLEFSELLRSASALIASVPPDDVATLLEEAAAALEGNGEALRDLAVAGDRLAATFAERTEALDRLATNNTRVTRVVTAHRGALGSSITDLRLLAGSLRASSGDTTVLLERGALLLTQAADLVETEKPTIDCVLKGLELLVDETTTERGLDELDALLRIGPDAFDGVWQSRDVEPDGPWIRVGSVDNPENRPTMFVPPRELPAPAAVQRCRSQFGAVQAASAGTGDYRPRDRSALDGPLPATGAAGSATALVVLALGALAGRRLRSRS